MAKPTQSKPAQSTGKPSHPPSLWTAPLTTLFLFAKLIYSDLIALASQYKKLLTALSALASVYFIAHFVPFLTAEVLQIDEILLFGLFWIGLGVLSSIGLGTGLHTFVLYLGPKIIRYVLASSECGRPAVMLPNRFALFPSFGCPTVDSSSSSDSLSFWSILSIVQLESFLWGFGTAIGELPPYVVSRAARLQGSKAEELEELEREQNETSIFGRLKGRLFGYVRQNAFVTVLLLASFPNPLFDLAGLTCGHLLVPFWTFFIATMIGKAIVKVHLQVASIIFLFSKAQIDLVINYLRTKISSNLGEFVSEFIEKQRKSMLTNIGTHVEKENWLGTIWNVVLMGMIGYFLASIINSRVQQHFASVNKEK